LPLSPVGPPLSSGSANTATSVSLANSSEQLQNKLKNVHDTVCCGLFHLIIARSGFTRQG